MRIVSLRCRKRAVGWLLLALLSLLPKLPAIAQEVTDSLVLEQGRPLIFSVNKAEFSQKDIDWILDTLKVELGDSTLRRLYVRAGASPEGPYATNVRLSKARYNALNKIFQQYQVPENKISYDIIPEDYRLLHAMMKRNQDAQFPVLDSLMTQYGDDAVRLKLAMQRYDGGRMWRRLLKEYFPSLRAVRLMLFNEVPVVEKPLNVDTVQAEPVVEVAEQPEPAPVDTPKVYVEPAREPMLSVKTNLLYDAMFMPKLGYSPIVNIWAEYYFHDSRYTLVGEYDFPWWSRDSKHHYFQVLNWTLEGRRFFQKEAVRQGWFLSVYGQGNYWDFSFNAEDAWQGEGFGAGVGGGWVKRLGKDSRWKLEFFLKAGVYVAQYDPYHAGDPYKGRYYYDWQGDVEDFKRRNHRFTWVGPTSIGINLSYDLLYRRADDGKVTWRKLFKNK